MPPYQLRAIINFSEITNVNNVDAKILRRIVVFGFSWWRSRARRRCGGDELAAHREV